MLQAVSTTCTDRGVYVAADQLHVIPILRREDVYEKKKKKQFHSYLGAAAKLK